MLGMEAILSDIVLGTFTLSGVAVGTCLNRYYILRDKKKEQIIRLQNVQLVLVKMLNEFENMEKYFQSPDSSCLALDKYGWILSKEDLLSLNIDSDEEMIMLLYSLMQETKKFNDLRMIIQDELDGEAVTDASSTQAIRGRIQAINLEGVLKRLYDYSKKKYPHAKFITRKKK